MSVVANHLLLQFWLLLSPPWFYAQLLRPFVQLRLGVVSSAALEIASCFRSSRRRKATYSIICVVDIVLDSKSGKVHTISS